MWIDYELLTRVVYINLIVRTIVYSITEEHALVVGPHARTRKRVPKVEMRL